MAGFNILNDLTREIRFLLQDEVRQGVGQELSEYKKARTKDINDLKQYEFALEQKYAKQNEATLRKLRKKRFEDEAKYLQTHEERMEALRKQREIGRIVETEDKRGAFQKAREESAERWQRNLIALQEAAEAKRETNRKKSEQAIVNSLTTISKVGEHVWNTTVKGVNEYIGAFSKYFTTIEVGLLGTGRGFNSAKSLIDGAVGLSPIVKQTEVLENLQRFIEKGILQDAEMRATLATVGTKISNTFNALDPTILSLTRVLQEDTTISRLGMEAALSRYMAGTYGDTSYFANDTNAYVSSQLMQAMSQMQGGAGVEMEYAVQKWLGSFVSVGVSEETAKRIADGIGYLTSGNITGLTSDTTLMNLILAAANKGNVDIATVLQSGADASTIDSLMRGLYSQVGEIAASGNQVVKSQYAGLYGMSISDITAMQNLTAAQVAQNLTSNQRESALENLTMAEMSQLRNRIATSTIIENAIDNVMSVIGEEIAANPAMSITWRIADMLTQAGGITLPSVLALGNGFAQLPDIDQLMKLGLMTGSVVSAATKAIGNLNGFGDIAFSKLLESGNISSQSSVEQIQLGQVAVGSNAGATFIGDTSASNLLQTSMAQVEDLVQLTGQDEGAEEQPATSADIDRLIFTIEEEGRKNRGENYIKNNGPQATIRWG